MRPNPSLFLGVTRGRRGIWRVNQLYPLSKVSELLAMLEAIENKKSSMTDSIVNRMYKVEIIETIEASCDT